jgi:hypothetical protein
MKIVNYIASAIARCLHSATRKGRNSRPARGLFFENLKDRVVLAPILYAHDRTNRLYTVDVATGQTNIIGTINGLDPRRVLTDIAFAPDGRLYGIDGNPQPSSLYLIDPVTAQATRIGAMGAVGAAVNALVFSPSGTLFAAGTELYSIDINTGTGTVIGNGLGLQSDGDLAFDATGTLYLTANANPSNPASPSYLARVDTMTGTAAVIGPIGFNLVFGLAFGPDGVMYGLSNASEQVFPINLTTGAGSAPVNFGASVNGVRGSTFLEESVRVSISDATVVEGDSGTVNCIFNVALSSPTSRRVTVELSTTNGTATSPEDYTPILPIRSTSSPAKRLKPSLLRLMVIFWSSPTRLSLSISSTLSTRRSTTIRVWARS